MYEVEALSLPPAKDIVEVALLPASGAQPARLAIRVTSGARIYLNDIPHALQALRDADVSLDDHIVY